MRQWPLVMFHLAGSIVVSLNSSENRSVCGRVVGPFGVRSADDGVSVAALEVGMGATVVGEVDTVAVGAGVGVLEPCAGCAGCTGCGFCVAAAEPTGADTMLTPQVATIANSAAAGI